MQADDIHESQAVCRRKGMRVFRQMTARERMVFVMWEVATALIAVGTAVFASWLLFRGTHG